MDTLITWPLDSEHLELVSQPGRLHRKVMQLLPDLGGRSSAIRADTGTTFRVDLPNDLLGRRGVICVRVRSNALRPDAGELIESVPLVDGSRVVLQVAAEKRLTLEDSRISTRPVSDDEAAVWADELLARHGLEVVERLDVSAARPFGNMARSKRGPAFWIRDLMATVGVMDQAAAQAAVAAGIGRGKSYGLGMVIVLPPAPHDAADFLRSTAVPQKQGAHA